MIFYQHFTTFLLMMDSAINIAFTSPADFRSGKTLYPILFVIMFQLGVLRSGRSENIAILFEVRLCGGLI